MLYKRVVGKGGLVERQPALRFCGVEIFPIKKFLKFSAVINVQAILGSTHWRCPGKERCS